MARGGDVGRKIEREKREVLCRVNDNSTSVQQELPRFRLSASRSKTHIGSSRSERMAPPRGARVACGIVGCRGCKSKRFVLFALLIKIHLETKFGDSRAELELRLAVPSLLLTDIPVPVSTPSSSPLRAASSLQSAQTDLHNQYVLISTT